MKLSKLMKAVIYISTILFCILIWSTKSQAAENTVCMVENTEYSSIKEAVEDIQNGSGKGTIILTEDVTITECIYISVKETNEPINIVLDLAGHIVTNGMFPEEGEEYSTVNVFFVGEYCTFHLDDSVGNGMLYSRNCSIKYVYLDWGRFIMDGGAIQIDGPDDKKSESVLESIGVSIGSGTFIGNSGTIRAAYPFESYGDQGEDDRLYNRITINGGKYEAIYSCLLRGYNDVHINGGVFKNIQESSLTDAKDIGPAIEFRTQENAKDKLCISGGSFSGYQYGILYMIKSQELYATSETMNQLLQANSKICTPKNFKLYTNQGNPATFISDGADKITYDYSSSYEYQYFFYLENNISVKGVSSKVTLNACGGKVNNTGMKVFYDSTYGNLPTPSKTGYQFQGWYTNSSKGSKVTASSKVTAMTNHTLYAHWKPVSVKVSFQANGGIGLSKASIVAQYNCKLGTLPSIRRKNYIFGGWYTKKSGGKRVLAGTISKMSKMTTLYAHWTKVTVDMVKSTSLSRNNRKLTISNKKVKGAAGYQIVIARNSKFTRDLQSAYITGTKKIFSKLKKGTTYYVRVRAYKWDSTKVRVYGSWSTVKKIVI